MGKFKDIMTSLEEISNEVIDEVDEIVPEEPPYFYTRNEEDEYEYWWQK